MKRDLMSIVVQSVIDNPPIELIGFLRAHYDSWWRNGTQTDLRDDEIAEY